MSRIDALPADQRSVLQLLLKQGKGYDELSDLLGMPERRVRELARDALVELAALGEGQATRRLLPPYDSTATLARLGCGAVSIERA